MRVPFSRTFGKPITAPVDRMHGEKPWTPTRTMHPLAAPDAALGEPEDAVERAMHEAHEADRKAWAATCAMHFERALDTVAPATQPKGDPE